MNYSLYLLFLSFFAPMGLFAQSITEPNKLSSVFPLPDYVQPRVDYSKRYPFMRESPIKSNYAISEMDFELNENSALSGFNQLVHYARGMTDLTSEGLTDGIILFQTIEYSKPKGISHVYFASDTTHFVQSDSSQKILQTILYNDFIQRDIFIMGRDSTRITNWYVKRLNPNEIEEWTNERSVFQHEIDSLKLRMREMALKGESIWGLKMDDVRQQIDLRNEVSDSLDFLVYPSIRDSIMSFQTRVNIPGASERIDFQAMNISRYGNYKAGSDEIEFSHGEKATFITKRFRLNCVIDDQSGQQSVYFGDSTTYSGADILNNQMCRDLSQASSESDRSLTVFDGKYLVLESSETFIGETYQYSIMRRYWFEMVE